MSVDVEEYVKSYQRGYMNGRADAERIARYGYDPDTWTNFDRLHAMSVEELADFLYAVWKHESGLYEKCVKDFAVPFYKWLKEVSE